MLTNNSSSLTRSRFVLDSHTTANTERRWNLINIGGGRYRIQSASDGLYLTADPSSPSVTLAILDNADSNEEEKEEDSAEKPKYIGRQPPEGYVGPEGLEYRGRWMVEYKDTYQSNIVVILGELFETDHTDYAWFHPTSGDPLGTTAEIYDFVAYAILTYYDGDVPCDYSFYLEEDCHNMHPDSTWIFEIQTHGDRPLNICLDTYNYKIYVEEGIVERGLSWAEEHGQ
jgi:hypothetical protein